MSQDFGKQSDGCRVGQNLWRMGTQQGFTAAKEHVHRSQPGAEIVEGGLVLVQRRCVVFALILPDVAVHALGIAQIGHQKADVGGPAVIRPSPAGQGPQAVVDGRISAPVDLRHTEILKPRGHKAAPGVTSDSRSTSRVRFARPQLKLPGRYGGTTAYEKREVNHRIENSLPAPSIGWIGACRSTEEGSLAVVQNRGAKPPTLTFTRFTSKYGS